MAVETMSKIDDEGDSGSDRPDSGGASAFRDEQDEGSDGEAVSDNGGGMAIGTHRPFVLDRAELVTGMVGPGDNVMLARVKVHRKTGKPWWGWSKAAEVIDIDYTDEKGMSPFPPH